MAEQPPPDFFDAFAAGREALRRMQESFSRYAMPPEQRQALADGMAQLMFPTDRVRAISDLIDAFGPPLAQIETMRAEVAAAREQLDELDDRLARMEAMAERLAIAAEQVQAFQEPFLRMASMIPGFEASHQATDGSDDQEDDEDDDDEDEGGA